MFEGKFSWIAKLDALNQVMSERLYQIEHPRLVSLFDEVSPVDEGGFAYWISKPWVKGNASSLSVFGQDTVLSPFG